MAIASSDLILARQTISGVLDELGLDAYLFEAEPSGNQWSIVVECAAEGGWRTYTLHIEENILTAGSDDMSAHQLLLRKFGQVLDGCKRDT